MNGYEMIENGIIPTDLFGELSIVAVIIYYDYPRCFLAKGKHNQYFAFMENDDSEDSFGWNMTIVSLEDINNVNRGEQNVQSLFLDKDCFLVYSNGDICKVEKVASFVGKYEIRGNLFCESFCDMDEVFDFHKLQSISRDSKKTSISLVYESNVGSKTGILLKLINYVKEIMKKMNSKLDINESNFYVQRASTVITFEFDNTNNESLFDGNILDDPNNKSVLRFGSFLNASEPEQVLQESSDIVAVKKYSKMIEIFKEQKELRPKIVLALPQNDNAVSFDFNDSNCESKQHLLEQACEIYDSNKQITDEEIECEGILTGILTTGKNQFSFRTSSDIYSGKVDFSMLGTNREFSINRAIYKAKIKRTKVTNNGVLIKQSDVLLSIEKIGEIADYEQIELSV